MTDLLKRALEEAERILSAEEQNKLASMLLTELDAEKKWQSVLADPRSGDLLTRLAREALEEDEAGLTNPLDPDKL
jgi:hypothetical protein